MQLGAGGGWEQEVDVALRLVHELYLASDAPSLGATNDRTQDDRQQEALVRGSWEGDVALRLVHKRHLANDAPCLGSTNRSKGSRKRW